MRTNHQKIHTLFHMYENNILDFVYQPGVALKHVRICNDDRACCGGAMNLEEGNNYDARRNILSVHSFLFCWSLTCLGSSDHELHWPKFQCILFGISEVLESWRWQLYLVTCKTPGTNALIYAKQMKLKWLALACWWLSEAAQETNRCQESTQVCIYG